MVHAPHALLSDAYVTRSTKGWVGHVHRSGVDWSSALTTVRCNQSEKYVPLISPMEVRLTAGCR